MGDAWPFRDSPETGVYTTRQVFEEGAPLGVVSHDADGDWQFLHFEEEDDDGSDLRDVNDLLLVHFHHVVDHLPEVQQFADLPLGWIATRERPEDPWVREPQPEEWDSD